MSRSEWEEGAIVLPSTEFAKFRQNLADYELKRTTELFTHSQEFWKGLTAKQKADRDEYVKAFAEYEKKNSKLVYPPFGWGGKPELVSQLPEDLEERLNASQYGWSTAKPKRLLKEDIEFPTNRTTEFVTQQRDGYINFDKATNTVRWAVSSNNHAVEHARADPLAEAFFGHLAKVRWTRKTGGVMTGNDEYNQDNRENGGGSNYVTSGFGPIGAEDAPYSTAEYRMSDGTLVRKTDFPAAVKQQAEYTKARKQAATKDAAKLRRELAARAAARLKATEAATAPAGPQGRVGAGNGSKSGEFAAKGQSRPEVSL